MNQILPQRLRALREEKGLTQEKLAKELGVARMTIVCYESGKNSPDGNMLSNVRDFRLYAGLSLWLFQFKESTKPTGVDGVG